MNKRPRLAAKLYATVDKAVAERLSDEAERRMVRPSELVRRVLTEYALDLETVARGGGTGRSLENHRGKSG